MTWDSRVGQTVKILYERAVRVDQSRTDARMGRVSARSRASEQRGRVAQGMASASKVSRSLSGNRGLECLPLDFAQQINLMEYARNEFGMDFWLLANKIEV